MEGKREAKRETIWAPHAGPQTRFLASPARECLYGGAAGGGKTDALLVYPLRWVHLPHFTGIIFRRTYPELTKKTVPRSEELYRRAVPGATYHTSEHVWRFPSGARIYFSHLEDESSIYQHQSAEYQYIGFDELTTFLEQQYRYLMSRGRSPHGIPIRIRGGTNPEPNWVLRRFGPWVDTSPTYRGPRAADGEILWYRIDESTGDEVWVPMGTPGAMSRQFIRARLEDNPTLCQNDPAYKSGLADLDPVQRARLRDGDWLAAPCPGLYFRRGWCQFVEAAPAGVRRVRYWDLAGTREQKGTDPDWTAGVRMARDPNGLEYIEDVVRFRGSPHEVQAQILATAETDETSCGRHAVAVYIEQDPGQAGKFQAAEYTRKLAAFQVRTVRPTGDKTTRFGPFSTQAEAGNVRIVRGPWNAAYLTELERFPSKEHDDQADATSGAHMALVSGRSLTCGVAAPTSRTGRTVA